MNHISREYQKLLFKHFDIKTTFKPPLNTLLEILHEYNYKLNNVNDTILFLELMHELILRNIEKEK